jgi:hypothetical protein
MWLWVRSLTLSDWGSLASFASLVVTVVVWFSVRNLRTAYLFAARLPELVTRLSKHASTISSQLNSFQQTSQDVPSILGPTQATLQSISRKLPRASRGSVRRLIKQVQAYKVAVDGEPGLRAIYAEILKVSQEAKDLYEDRRWEQL